MYRWWIAYKYICSRFITVAALLAVTLSVTVLIIVVRHHPSLPVAISDAKRALSGDQ